MKPIRNITRMSNQLESGARRVVLFLDCGHTLSVTDAQVAANRDFWRVVETDKAAMCPHCDDVPEAVIKADKWDRRFLAMAALVGSWSKDPSTQVGAVITTPDNLIVSMGYNGFPRHMRDDPALLQDREEKLARTIHAEMNALLFATFSKGCTVYTHPMLPCERCCVHLIQAGIVRFVAPVLSSQLHARWGEAVARSRSYIHECGALALEVE